jgi:predicted metal-dependent hydrolase
MSLSQAGTTKKERMERFVETLDGAAGEKGWNRFYQGYFECFNAQQYYEAHDVLECLWLQERGEEWLYWKGLIQLAGAFVHLQKQFQRPTHPKDGRRLRPAVRLFHLAMRNLERYRPHHLGLDVDRVYQLCEEQVQEIVESGFVKNPWHPHRAPILVLQR